MERLYYDDSYLTEFTAAVTASKETAAGFAVALDRSAFYPEGGGQPDDRGEIDGRSLLAVREDAEGIVWHHLAAGGPAPAGRIAARVDWRRRYDLMQQHTGQHLLSAAFARVADLATVGFHLTESNLQIDLDRWVEPEQAEAAEDLANLVIREDRAVTCRFVGEGEMAAIVWRKPPPAHHGPIRLVSVEEFDSSPCGGTHVRHTSEVGLIKITGLDRVRGGARVSFLCGGRAIRDYGEKLRLVAAMVRELHVPPEGLGEALARLRGQLSGAEREIGELRGSLLELEAERLAQAGEPVTRVYPGRPFAEVRQLAARLAAAGKKAVLARTDNGEAQLVAVRPDGPGPDLAAALRAFLARVGGKGGGTAAFAQGGVPAAELPLVLAELEQLLKS